jgi:hypothetical protein
MSPPPRPKTSPQAASVYEGRVRLGRIVGRGKLGFEAFDADDRSLGVYGSERSAADAISAAAGGRS